MANKRIVCIVENIIQIETIDSVQQPAVATSYISNEKKRKEAKVNQC